MTIRHDNTFAFAGGATRVLVGEELLAEVGGLCRDICGGGRALVVSDETVAGLYGESVRASLESAGIATDMATVAIGEGSKSLTRAAELYDRLAAHGVGRDGLVVGVGGGMVTDLAGFVGGTWMRGIATVLCPTTLEADIDASIGGKTAVNHSGGKNLIGVFHQPRLVVIDAGCLTTLPRRDVAAGLAESIKHAVITDGDFLEWHEKHRESILACDPSVLTTLIDRNIAIKSEFVLADERDLGGRRAMLNFGHTLGHALELLCGYRYRHGECVSLGMVAACRISQSLELIPPAVTERITGLLASFGLPIRLDDPVDVDEVCALIKGDKKAAAGAVRFVLLDGLGHPVLRGDVEESAIRNALSRLQP